MASFLYNEEMKKKHTRRNFIFAVLILTIAYWAGINMLVSAVLVPSCVPRCERRASAAGLPCGHIVLY